jgi:hypothetical protein
MARQIYSLRAGRNPNAKGFDLSQIVQLFVRLFGELTSDGYFHEAFGFFCIDEGSIVGSVKDIDYDILICVRKSDLWPPGERAQNYTEDDFLDILEYLFQKVSKPIDGTMHSWGECGMHWSTFNKREGEIEFRRRVNELLALYRKPFELADNGEILQRPAEGFEAIFEADVPAAEGDIEERIRAATLKYRRHGATLDDRRHAVRDLADVLEFLRPRLHRVITRSDEGDLFNIANNFGIRHLNDKQKTRYDEAIWLSWMFYYYLATVHAVLRMLERSEP